MVSVAKIAMAPATCAGSSSGATFASLRASVSARETSRTSVFFGRSDVLSEGTGDHLSRGAGCTASMKRYTATCCSAPDQWRSEEHTSELQSPYVISYAVFCLKKK